MFNWGRIVEKIDIGAVDATLYGYENWFSTEAAMQAIESKETIYSRQAVGFLTCSSKDFLDKINPKFRKVYDAGKCRSIFVSDNSLCVFSDEEEGNADVTILSTDQSEIENFEKISKEYLEKTKRNTVSVLTASMDGYYLTPIGTLDAPLVRENYTSEVLSGFDFVVKDLESSNPFGRLSIINGPPGTGKTYLIRGIINELKKNTVVLIPPKMIAEIDGPSLLPTFISHKRRSKRPITLIIEDADACLAPRMGDNMSSISSLLNHTDGILGSLLDLKIIATTNQDNMEFDDALVRAGRLSRHIEIQALGVDKANEIYKRLSNKDDVKYDEHTVLADIYADAKILGSSEIASDDPNFDPDPGKFLRSKTARRLGF